MKVINSNKYIILRVPKKIAVLSFVAVSVFAVGLVSLKPVNAQTSEPQPTGTSFTWGSVSAGTSRASFVRGLSYDGRYLLFASASPLLVEGDTNAGTDIFVKDLQTQETERVSVDNSGAQLSNVHNEAVISANGRYAAFTQLVGSVTQVFVRDRTAGTTTLMSSDSSGVAGNGSNYPLSISDNGTLAINSSSTNIVPGVTSGAHIFLKEISSGAISELPFVDPTGSSHVWSVNNSYAEISADSSTVMTLASDTSSTNTRDQVVAQDLVHGTAQTVSYTTSPSTQSVDYISGGLSRDGRYALFGEHNASWSATVSTLFMRDLQTGTITAIDQAPSGRTNNGVAAIGGRASVLDGGTKVGFATTATTLDPSFNPSRSASGNIPSQYIANTSTGVSTMVVNQISGDSYYAPGAEKFGFNTADSIDNADPDGTDAYTAHQ